MRYARSGDLSIAYQVLGTDGPDLVLVPGFVSHLDLAWEEACLSGFLSGLASFSRLIWFDRRGTGLSDPSPDRLTMEAAADDVRAVMRAAGVDRPTLFGVAVGASICTRVALDDPASVRRLVLWAAHARLLADTDYPAGWSADFLDHVLGEIDRSWATGESAAVMNPSLAGDERFRDWFARNARAAASPAQVRELFGLCAAVDLRAEFCTVGTPTLLLHRRGDPWLSVEHSRSVARLIPAARLVEFPGADHWPWIGDSDAVLTEVEAFVTGHRPGRRERPRWGPRSLTRREREVADFAVQGLSAQQIGTRLFISERTVETHIASAYRKLGVRSRVELVRRAADAGL
ncbi:alpha/beta fold hydrolase [Blastococcus jejuensis]|uniref:Alpha/beta fold hydrolase n=1 Tax=Blastococcus jejuensis TaxID=351224 RepID=A0ABP6PGZ9_9ACTN